MEMKLDTGIDRQVVGFTFPLTFLKIIKTIIAP